MRKLILILALALLGCSTTATPQEVEHPTAAVKKPKKVKKQVKKQVKKIDWQPFSDELIKVSRALGKPLFLLLREDKKFSNLMEDFTLTHPLVVDIINKRFIATKVDVEKHPERAKMFYKDGKFKTPKIVFIRPREEGPWLIAEATGYLDVFKMMEAITQAEETLNDNSDKKGPGKHKGVPSK